jgi:rhodanese-related sulfurtransferase
MKRKSIILSVVFVIASILPACQSKKQDNQQQEVTEVTEQSITIEEFGKQVLETPDAQVLDVRSAEEYEVNHIKGAINIDLSDSIKSQEIIEKLNPDIPTFTYSIREGRSAFLANKLKEKGFKTVYYMPGGIGAWVGAGFDIESSVDPTKSIDIDTYNKLIAEQEFTFVDISSVHCGGCKKLHPILDKLEKEFTDVKILRYELDENLQLVQELKVKVLPTLIFYKKGEPVWQHTGTLNEEELRQVFNEYSK